MGTGLWESDESLMLLGEAVEYRTPDGESPVAGFGVPQMLRKASLSSGSEGHICVINNEFCTSWRGSEQASKYLFCTSWPNVG